MSRRRSLISSPNTLAAARTRSSSSTSSAVTSGRRPRPARNPRPRTLPPELIQLYAERKRRMGYAFAADTPWQAEFEDNFPYAETDDQLRCIERDQGGHGVAAAHGPSAVRRRRLRQDRGRAARGHEGRARRQAGRHPRADDRAGAAALHDGPQPLPRLPREHRRALPLLAPRSSSARSCPICARARSTLWSARTSCCRRTWSSTTSAFSS